MTNVYGFDGQAGRHTNRLLNLIVMHAAHMRAHIHTHIYIWFLSATVASCDFAAQGKVE